MNTGSGFTDLSNGGVYGGVTTTTLTVTGAALAMNGYQYRAVFTNGTAPDATTAAATLTVNAALGIAPTTLPAGVANTLYHQTISVSGGTTPYTTFTVSGFSAGGTGLTLSEITANAPDGSGTLSSATVYARISASATANVSGNLTLADALHSSVNKSLAVSGTVNPVVTTPPITWSNPADITYGKALGATQLDATTSVPGWFSR